MSISADPTEMFDRFTVCALDAGQCAGRLALRAGTETVTFDLAARPAERPECRTMRLASAGIQRGRCRRAAAR